MHAQKQRMMCVRTYTRHHQAAARPSSVQSVRDGSFILARLPSFCVDVEDVFDVDNGLNFASLSSCGFHYVTDMLEHDHIW